MFLKIKMLFLLLGLMLGSVEPRADSVVQMLGSRFMERASIVALNESGCAPPWIETTVGCIVFLHTEVDTWAGAQAECDSLGGFLVEAKTEEEALILSQLAMVVSILHSVDSWWLGLTDWAHEGTWVWIHAREESTYFHWATEPDMSEENHQDCVRMAKKDRFRWSDTDCVFTKAAPICERVVLGLLEEDRIDTSNLQLAFEDVEQEKEEEEEEISMLDGDLFPQDQ